MSRILLAVSGSIAAYKTADLVSLLIKQGHEVRCLLTPSAQQFISPLVLETLSGNPVSSALFGPEISGTEHIRLARWAELLVFAPATAHLLAKLSLGLADDLVSTVALATRAPWLVAPAMNTVMWEQPVTQEHVRTLERRGVRFVAPAEGTLACGEVGAGKLAPVETLAEQIELLLAEAQSQNAPARDLEGLRVLITAGPTTSPIDAVRYLTNHSTGKMGAALAEEALRRGATVDYILGVDKGVIAPHPQSAGELCLVRVRTAEQMLERALEALPRAHGVIATAAVLDYRVAAPSQNKQKRAQESVTLELLPSVDVLKELRKQGKPGQWFMGFAAETDSVLENGRAKLERKELDFLFANEVAQADSSLATGFGGATNGGWFFRKNAAAPEYFEVQSKSRLAHALWNALRSPAR